MQVCRNLLFAELFARVYLHEELLLELLSLLLDYVRFLFYLLIPQKVFRLLRKVLLPSVLLLWKVLLKEFLQLLVPVLLLTVFQKDFFFLKLQEYFLILF